MKQQEFIYDNIDSIAINKISINNKLCTIVFKSSPKEYNYTVNDSNFNKSVENTIKNSESVGKLVNKAIKENKLELVTINSNKLNKSVV